MEEDDAKDEEEYDGRGGGVACVESGVDVGGRGSNSEDGGCGGSCCVVAFPPKRAAQSSSSNTPFSHRCAASTKSSAPTVVSTMPPPLEAVVDATGHATGDDECCCCLCLCIFFLACSMSLNACATSADVRFTPIRAKPCENWLLVLRAVLDRSNSVLNRRMSVRTPRRLYC